MLITSAMWSACSSANGYLLLPRRLHHRRIPLRQLTATVITVTTAQAPLSPLSLSLLSRLRTRCPTAKTLCTHTQHHLQAHSHKCHPTHAHTHLVEIHSRYPQCLVHPLQPPPSPNQQRSPWLCLLSCRCLLDYHITPAALLCLVCESPDYALSIYWLLS